MRNSFRRTVRRLLVAVCLCLPSTTFVTPVQAQQAYPPIGLPGEPVHIWPIHPWPIRPWPIPPRDQQLLLDNEKASVTLNGSIAVTHLTLTLRNPLPARSEGTFLFPLPVNAAVSDFTLTMNGVRTDAEILDSEKARSIYEGIVAQLRDPAILEFEGDGLLRAHIFPVDPGATVEVDLGYSEALRTEAGATNFTLPMRLPIGGDAASASLDLRLDAPGLKAVYSPTHPVEIKRDNSGARVTGEWNAAADNPTTGPGDFELVYTQATGQVGLSLLTFGSGPEDRYFLLLAAPDAAIGKKEVAAKDTVFILDTSGSMEGAKIDQAKRALSTVLGNLNAGDRFDLITFASDVNPFTPGLVDASTDNLKQAQDFIGNIKAVGGTDIDDALQTALAMFKGDTGRPRQIVFLTDGQPTVGETNLDAIEANVRAANPDGIRLFVFGVGYDVNTQLLDTLADQNGGSSDYVRPADDIEAKVGALYAKIAYPVLTRPQLSWGGAPVYDLYPPRLPDLFRGTQAIAFGRIRGDGMPTVQLTGTVTGQTVQVEGVIGTGSDAVGEVPRLWATRKIGYLLDDARRNGHPVSDEVRQEIFALGKRFGIVTPFTSALVSDDTVPAGPGTPRPPGPYGPFLFNGPLSGSSMGRAGDDVPRAFAGDALAANTGEAGVTASQAVHAYRDTEQATPTEGRLIDGKCFNPQNGVWIDSAYDATKALAPKVVHFASQEYFALTADPHVAHWLSVGDRVILVLPDGVVEVEP